MIESPNTPHPTLRPHTPSTQQEGLYINPSSICSTNLPVDKRQTHSDRYPEIRITNQQCQCSNNMAPMAPCRLSRLSGLRTATRLSYVLYSIINYPVSVREDYQWKLNFFKFCQSKIDLVHALLNQNYVKILLA